MEILLGSSISQYFSIIPFNTNIHKSLLTLGKIDVRKIFSNFTKYIGLIFTIVKEKPHLAHIPISQTTIGFLKDSLFIVICRLFRIKIVIQLHGSNLLNWLESSTQVIKTYVRYILSLTDGVIVLGENLRYLFEPFFKKEQIFVVPNGADYNVAGQQSSPGNRILYLSNLQPSKGIPDLINALLILKRDYKLEFQSNIVGDWFDEDTRKLCHDIVYENDLPVEFHSPAYGDKKFRFYADSDIFVFAPREPEGHPWVIVESMAAGLPIISTDQGAIRESVVDGVNGFLVEKQSPKQIAEKIKILIENPDLRRKMGDESRRLYLENFTEEKMVNRLVKVFNTVMNSN